MNYYREKKNSITCKGMCICHKTQKHLATGRYTNGHKRWPPYDIWSDDQV